MVKSAKRKQGVLVVISGPSGVGKSTILQKITDIDPEIELSISCTTRKPRVNENNGAHYFFISEEEFRQKVKHKEFLEWAQVHNYYYGTPKEYILNRLKKGHTTIVEVDVQGAASIKEEILKGKFKAQTVFIFLIPPSVDILAFRLRKRKTEQMKEMNYRLRAAIAELQVMEKYDYIVVNDRVETAAKKILAIINVEKERMMIN
jgi:guanylate kinase